MQAYAVHKISGVSHKIVPRVMRHARLKRRVRAWAAALEPQLTGQHHQAYRLVMVTCTYAPPATWHPNDIRHTMQHIRENLADKLLAYAWVAELQFRGEVHYHILLLVVRGTDIPKPDEAGWWAHGSTKIETARQVWYIVKYTQKGNFQNREGAWLKFPKGARLFAVWIADRIISKTDRYWFRLTMYPGWLRELIREVFPLAEIEKPRWGGYRLWPHGGDPPTLVWTPWLISWRAN